MTRTQRRRLSRKRIEALKATGRYVHTGKALEIAKGEGTAEPPEGQRASNYTRPMVLDAIVDAAKEHLPATVPLKDQKRHARNEAGWAFNTRTARKHLEKYRAEPV